MLKRVFGNLVNLCRETVAAGSDTYLEKMVVEEGEGSSPGKKGRMSGRKDHDFVDLVFSWSLEDIFNEDLYKNQVDKIPNSFQSVENYLGSYVYPLLEETRAELASSMETISRAPFAEVIAIEDASKPSETLRYNVTVDYWRNRFSDKGKEPYKTLPGDIFVFCDAKPETNSDLLQMGRTWCFASVTSISEDQNEDTDTSAYFKVKASKDIGDGIHKSLFVIFLMNITTIRRIWSAIHMMGNTNIIKEVLCNNNVVGEKCSICPLYSNAQLTEGFDTSLLSGLNESQRDAILDSLLKLKCEHKSSVGLIWGPPGTGKTKTVSMMLLILLRMNCRTVVCAPTNVAIMEVASRLLKLIFESKEVIHNVGDILLFGNKDRLKVDSDIQEIHLDYRVKRLTECLVPITGWKNCITSMMDLLKDGVSQYHVFVENEQIKAKQASDGIEVSRLENKSFLMFLRDRFRSTAPHLKRCILILCTHLPRKFIQEVNWQNMLCLVHLLEQFEVLLFQDTMVSEELEEFFSHLEDAEDSSDSLVDTSLMYVRSKVFSVLETLQCSLEELKLPRGMNEDAIKDFCFQRASLFFCTASTSFKLRSEPIAPLNMVVIDEAAQLKECESTIPLQLRGVRHCVLIGDEYQLPAMVRSEISAEAGLGRSLFERLSSLGHSKNLLNVQYRMHPSISFFPNSKFYLNQILDATTVMSKSYEKHFLQGPMFGPYSFINVVGGKEEKEDIGYSLRNMVEVAIVSKIVQYLYRAWIPSQKNLSVGVISPYAAQVVAIQDKIGQKYKDLDGFSVKVKSVDGFQGGEEDIIILSTVRSNIGGAVGFLSSPQRTNVSLTRARHCLWILGNERTLRNSDSVWEALVLDSKSRKCFFNADEDKNIAKVILDTKKELDQLDDLLNPDSVLFKNARWKVSFSDNFKKSFCKLISTRMKKSVINLLLKLSGGWRPRHINVDLVCESSSQIIKKFKVEGLYVICTIDIVKESQYMQVLKVWDILPVEEIPKLVKRLDSIFSMYTEELISRCNEKFLEGDLEIPKTWVLSHGIERFRNPSINESVCDPNASAVDGRSYVENSKVSESLLLMKFYSLSSGVVSHLLSDRGDKELDLPFEVTDKEREIILFPKSSFILGRSGTGKTTILTMKLFQREHRFHVASKGFYEADNSAAMSVSQKNDIGECIGAIEETVLRQLFVTVSPKLCYAVKQQVSQLKRFARGSGTSSENDPFDADDADDSSLFEDIPDSFVNIPSERYPLVVTFHKFIMMLDGTLGNSFFERFHEVRDFFHDTSRSSRSVGLQSFIRMKEVNYDRFFSFYWPHFNTDLKKKLDPSRVFTEIISHIKGGLLAEEGHATGKLVREDYLSLSDSRVSTLSSKKRENIYDIFQDYEKMKMERREFDLADIVIDLHRRLRNQIYQGDKMDFVYIDEVQDLTMRQISLFKYVCRNVDEGFVFSGDTAQTIARGIDFRFQDIRSLFFKEFMVESSSSEFSGKKDKGQISDIFKLQQNFRTHAAVLNLAQSVIDLLYRFFPKSIDVLEPETSLILGEAPVLLEPGNDENAIVTIFGNSGVSGGKMIGFGAEQVILVRDDDVKKDISAYVGKKALLLTIIECKGLEFQDVLLYNFFGSSPLKNHWRVVYEYMAEQDLLDPTCPKSFPTFNEAKHNILGSELKQLYVAITRTRQRLWICENKEDLSKPMFHYWKTKGLVQLTKLDDSLAQAMQVASSPDEWKARGIKLFREHNYELATMCFEHAGDIMWEKRAKASGLKATADRLRSSTPDVSASYLREAADLFVYIGKSSSAAECFFDLGDYEIAGKTYEKCGEAGLKKAAECFTLAERYDHAANVYAKGKYFSECLSVCTKGKLFDMGLQYIEDWKQHAPIDNGLVNQTKEIERMEQEFLESCALNYHELKDLKSMMKFVGAFHSMELKRNFLKSRDCIDELLLLEEEAGNFVEAAEICRLRGDLLKEVDLLGKAGRYDDASLLILWFVFANSLWVSGSCGWPLKQFTEKQELLERAMSFAKNETALFYELVCSEVNTLTQKNSNFFEMLKSLYTSRKHKCLRGEIISLRNILDAHLHLHSSKFDWVNEVPLNIITHSEDKLSRNHVSAETLVYSWNMWKDNIINVFEYLQSLQTKDPVKYMGHGEFCLNYFGVRRQFSHSNVVLLLLNPDANWVRKIDDRSLKKHGKLLCVDALQFVSAARYYWQLELLAVGMKVLEALEALYKLSTKSSVFRQSMCLLHIFEVSKFLLECNFLDHTFNNSRSLQTFLKLSTNSYVSNVFPLDWRMSSNMDMISLRGMDISCNLLEEVILEYINAKGEVTYGTIGRVLMLWLGSRRPQTGICEKIFKRFEGSFPWIDFIKDLSGNIDDSIYHGGVSLIFNFHKALEDTYRANWRKLDYISPSCFLYHVDRLVVMVSDLNGFIFTTKSSFLEWMMYQHSVVRTRTELVVDMQLTMERVFDSVVEMICQFLYNNHDTSAWITRSKLNVNYYYPLLVLKLFVILCLLCLNSKKYFEALFILLGRGDITCLLPRDFCNGLRRSRGRNYLNLTPIIVSDAFKRIGDPLVIASTKKARSKVVAPDAIFVDIEILTSKQDVMKVMFPSTSLPRNVKAAEVYSTHQTDPCREQVPASNDNSGGRLIGPSADAASISNQNAEMNRGNEVLMNWEVFHEITNTLTLGKNKGKGNLSLPNTERMKGELEKDIKILSAVIQSFDNKPTVDGNLLSDTNSMIDELKQLLSAFNTSEHNCGNISSIKQLVERIQGRRPKVESFLKNQLFELAPDSEKSDKDSSIAVEAKELEEDGDGSSAEDISPSNIIDKGKSKSTHAPEVQAAGNKGKGNNKKSKKGKKGKGKR